MKTYEFTIHRTVRVRLAMTEEHRSMLKLGANEARETLQNYMDNAGRPGAPGHLRESIHADSFREVKP